VTAKITQIEHNGHSQDVLGVPLDSVGVVVGCGVEPEVELLLPAADAIGEDVGVQRVGLAGEVAEELQVDLVVVLPRTFRDRLQYCTRARTKRFHVSEVNYLTYISMHWSVLLLASRDRPVEYEMKEK
jgi:hypothetical protein